MKQAEARVSRPDGSAPWGQERSDWGANNQFENL